VAVAVFGNASGGTLSSGGDGGSATGNGAGGIGDIAGAAGIGQVGGVGGGQASPANGGLGGTSLLIGGTGGGTDTVGQGIGANGAKSSVVTGSGLLDVTAGQNFGTAANPIKVEVSSLKLTVPGSGLIPSGNVGILDTAGSPLNLVSAALGSGVIFNLTTGQNPGTTGADGTINVNGNVTAGTVNFTTNGDAGPNNININAPITGQTIIGGPVLNFSNINLTSNGGTIKTFGPGLLTSTGGALRATETSSSTQMSVQPQPRLYLLTLARHLQMAMCSSLKVQTSSTLDLPAQHQAAVLLSTLKDK
jgi:hypothetical protein